MKELTPGHVLITMQEAFELDPCAMHALCCAAVPVNEALAEHPTISCRVAPVTLPGQPLKGQLSVLGLINGFLLPSGKSLTHVWEVSEGGQMLMTGFRLMDVPEAPSSDDV